MSNVNGLKVIEEKIEQLPFLPITLSELLRLKKNDDSYFEKLVGLAEKDPSLATLILTIANSSAYASRAEVDNLQLAMTRIGTTCVAGYIATLGITRVFVPTHEEQKLLWRHSIETAMLAEQAARYMPELRVDPGLAYVCGLLHDIGRIVMFDTAPNALENTPSSCWGSAHELPKVEQEILGYDHSQVGLLACKHWELPKTICNVVRGHHLYSIYSNTSLAQDFRNLILLIQFADFISINFLKYPEWLELPEKELQTKLIETCIHTSWCPEKLPVEKLSQVLFVLMEKTKIMNEFIGCA